MKTLLCFGFGFFAKTLADRLAGEGFRVLGTTRTIDKTNGWPAYVEPLIFGSSQPLKTSVLAGVTHILTSIPPTDEGDPVLKAHLADLKALTSLAWVGYLGTTAVYGDRQGAWVNEDDPIQPTMPRAVRRAAAEQAWLGSGLPSHIFRLAGIYGPGRNPLLNVRAGKARRIDKPGQVFSRIHVADIASVLQASIAKPNPGSVYNVCDDEPAPPQDVVGYAASLLGIKPPPLQPYETADLSPMARSFYLDNRRVSNEKIKRELGVQLAFPTYRDGLDALLADLTI